ncbi:C4b-binding protein alpha chain [Varanus komodoensis]|nr:C4b-binding protein alpha chain [Varanus komodoensis]
MGILPLERSCRQKTIFKTGPGRQGEEAWGMEGKGKSCGHPGKPENGEAVILTDFLYLAKVHFTCEDGLMGYPSIQCALNETEVEWQPKPPKCQQITCSPPPNISHSSHDGESIRIFAYNSTVTYKCDHGFSLMGDASIRCATEDKISGVWEGSKPECKGAAGPLCPHCAFRKLHRLPAVGAKPGQFRGEDGFGSEKPLDLGFQLFQHGAGLAYFPATGFKVLFGALPDKKAACSKDEEKEKQQQATVLVTRWIN